MKLDNVLAAKGNDNEDTSHVLNRGLSNRHIQLISIGGAIGTGLFMGAGKTISLSGTSIILTYMIIGFFLFFVMRALGELLLSNLKYKSFTDFVSEYIGPWAGFFVGWSYWLTYVVVVIADCTIIAGYMQFWYPELPTWIPSLAVLGILFTINLVSVRMFGELEFWFALIKILAISALIICGFVMVGMSYSSPNGVQASFSHLVEPGSMFPFGLSGFFAGFQIAIFSFAGIEVIGTTAAEAHDPHKTLPRAVNSIPVRVLIFYVLSLVSIISVSSWAQVSPGKSPFVQLFVHAGLPAAAAFINLIVITSAMSAANTGVYATSRMLFGMGANGQSAKFFSNLTKSKVPLNGLFLSCICMLVGLSLLLVIPELMTVFTVLSTISAILFIFTWATIMASYLIYRKRAPHLHRESKFKMPLGVVMSWMCLAFFVFVTSLLALEPDTRLALSMMPVWFILLAIMYKRSARQQKAVACGEPITAE
ncbi:D-serine/D-alanine/glycine:proton symporter, AAT family [Pseudomonas syringae]|uniref:Amino acid permease/ SLC12A domain-containing protein n=1 Tax=Pseudomonas syringae pv. apii TaxID=81036 RepID=A0A3M3N8U3_9PSED|nr:MULTISPECIES: amino acid permease [Pseudomonas syringae group]RMN40293.1 hypothetical protein ALQ59_200198 [Pseudomonas syringae pv. apii]RMN56169.1 hypothetical protein ALQ58_200016 [Pseudomonas syringae pv. apii]RMO02702.1 hypothetical protein ALQ49_02410 [Pseudomonas syringae pv. apii]SDZ38723.1 D-serine/D-alanine/glycine:proton symporter, AAT family [Pseudomonas syringae]